MVEDCLSLESADQNLVKVRGLIFLEILFIDPDILVTCLVDTDKAHNLPGHVTQSSKSGGSSVNSSVSIQFFLLDHLWDLEESKQDSLHVDRSSISTVGVRFCATMVRKMLQPIIASPTTGRRSPDEMVYSGGLILVVSSAPCIRFNISHHLLMQVTSDAVLPIYRRS